MFGPRQTLINFFADYYEIDVKHFINFARFWDPLSSWKASDWPTVLASLLHESFYHQVGFTLAIYVG